VFWKDRLSEFDAVVLSCGDGLFPSLMNPRLFPVQLVHGQSVELQLPGSRTRRLELGLLSGKYISPTLDESLVLIGATHEFSAELLPQNEVVNELRCRTINMAPHIWELGSVHRVTKGTRVQSRRGKNGRQPIVGKIASDIHTNAWIFTGLSSRGLLYHGLYGEMLAEAVKLDSEMVLLDRCADIFWWRKDPCS
jgi:glycine/D-amino acid oxidase-like deaminating enzyme